MRRNFSGIILLIFFLMVALWLQPYILSVYHTEVAGKLMEDCLIAVYTDRLAPEQITDSDKLRVAVKHLEKAVFFDPRNVQAMRLLARAHLSLGQTQAALEVLQQASAIRPESPILHLELGDVYDSLGYTEEALREYEIGGVGSRSAPLIANYLKLADEQVRVGSGEVAIRLWYKVLVLDANNLYALYNLYRIHHELGDTKRASIYVERLASMNPQTVVLPLDFRLAEYQAKAITVLVEEGIWERERMLEVTSRHVQQSTEILPRLIAMKFLEVLLKQWPAEPELFSLHQTLLGGTQDTPRVED